ncbi:MAG: hypothetical protein KDC83_06120 [Flavobacteriales bacterium]|nr:hypothetical protein [Flavobacteriales bacterium]
MGIGFTLDSPLKVAKFGISSVVSLGDDTLMEKMRKHYCEKLNQFYTFISPKDEDFRAKRITAYLDLLHDNIQDQIESIKSLPFIKGNDLYKYFDFLPDFAPVKQEFLRMLSLNSGEEKSKLESDLRNSVTAGSIDVNVMTKLDNVNYGPGKIALPAEYNDAHASIRGFAKSKVHSSLVFSAGLNPKLYSYLTQFDSFFPNSEGIVAKKIILKVSDYRSAAVQGKFLAAKGIWVSEYRIESGLNCGGHAFATQGLLLGPILHEFKSNKAALESELSETYLNALNSLGKNAPIEAPIITVSAQGGIGTAEEQEFLMNEYDLISTGWGSPFLLVPEAVSIDNDTLDLLAGAKEEDLYLSGISPLGVPFNSVKGNTKDIQKQEAIEKGKPGAPCIRKKLMFNTEFTETPICTASRQYQEKKIAELKTQNLEPKLYERNYNKIVEKACICVGLGTSSLLVNNIDASLEGNGVSVCPGPNLAYFSRTYSLEEMIKHIYGKLDILGQVSRPHMFIKELGMYVDYLKEQILDLDFDNKARVKYVEKFESNLSEGIQYYKDLLAKMQGFKMDLKERFLNELNAYEFEIRELAHATIEVK